MSIFTNMYVTFLKIMNILSAGGGLHEVFSSENFHGIGCLMISFSLILMFANTLIKLNHFDSN